MTAQTKQTARPPSPLVRYLMLRVLPVTALILSVVGLAAVESAEHRVRNELLLRLSQEANHNLASITQRLNGIAEQARVFASNDLLINGLFDTERRDEYLTSFFHSLRIPGYEGSDVLFVDYRGRVVASNNPIEIGSIIEGPENWLRSIEVGGSTIRVDRTGLFVSVPMFFAGFPEGAIIVRLAPDRLAKVFAGAGDSALAAVDASGAVLFRSAPNFFADGEPDGNWIFVPREIKDFGSLTIYTGEQKTAAFASVTELRVTLIAAFGLALVVMACAIGFTALMARRQLDRLVDIIQSIRSTDDLQSRIRMDGPEEIRRLGDSFNGMLEALQGTTMSRDRIDSILKSMQEILIVSSATGDIGITNPAANRFLEARGLTRSDNVALALRSDLPPIQGALDRFIRITGNAHLFETGYIISNGEEVFLRWSKSVLRDAEGSPVGIIFIGQDVTERRRAERLKGEFISTVSHELRTPLTSISGSLGLLRAGAVGELPSKALDLIKLGHDNCERLVRLINDILDIQKLDTGGISVRREPVDLSRLCQRTIRENIAYADGFDVSIRFDNRLTDKARGWTIGDFDRLQQVLTNLISNAVKFSPAAGEILVALEATNGEVLLSVTDHGPGIPDNFRERIFQRFAQADSSDTRGKGGTGLGLAIVRSIVERLGGRVWYECPPNGGTVFHVALKAYEACKAATPEEKAAG